MKTNFRDPPALLSDQEQTMPWLAWERATRWNLDYHRHGAFLEPPPLTRALQKKERKVFCEVLQNLVFTTDHNMCEGHVWRLCMNAIQTTLPSIRTELNAMWDSGLGSFCGSLLDNRFATIILAGHHQPWGPKNKPDADLTASWAKAEARAPWAYAILDGWVAMANFDWGKPQALISGNTDFLEPWTATVAVIDDHLLLPIDQSHWRLAARQTLFALCAGLPGHSGLHALAAQWKLGWPRKLDGEGMANLGMIDGTIHCGVGRKKAHLQGPTEALIKLALLHHEKNPLAIPDEPPCWVPFLQEALAVQRGRPPSLFPDPALSNAIETWQIRMKDSLNNLFLPKTYEPTLEVMQRLEKWDAYKASLPAQWAAHLRKWKTEDLKCPPQAHLPRARSRP